MTVPSVVLQLATGTPQRCAAALTSIARAVAPACRRRVYSSDTLVLPPVEYTFQIGWM